MSSFTAITASNFTNVLDILLKITWVINAVFRWYVKNPHIYVKWNVLKQNQSSTDYPKFICFRLISFTIIRYAHCLFFHLLLFLHLLLLLVLQVRKYNFFFAYVLLQTFWYFHSRSSLNRLSPSFSFFYAKYFISRTPFETFDNSYGIYLRDKTFTFLNNLTEQLKCSGV